MSDRHQVWTLLSVTMAVHSAECCSLTLVIAGGTSVTGALECPSTEKRMIVSLDTSQMVGMLLLVLSCHFLLHHHSVLKLGWN